MASTYAPPTNRYPARAGATAWPRTTSPLLLLVASAAFLVSALAFLVPQTPAFTRVLTTPSVAPAPVQVSAEQLEYVLGHARAMQPDDSLVEVRPGVFAKHSNVHGVKIDGTTFYYDIASHQSFGPLRSGAVKESQINVVGREAQPNFLVLVYTRK